MMAINSFGISASNTMPLATEYIHYNQDTTVQAAVYQRYEVELKERSDQGVLLASIATSKPCYRGDHDLIFAHRMKRDERSIKLDPEARFIIIMYLVYVG